MLTSFNSSQRFNFITSNIPSLSYHFSKIVKSQFLVTLVITIYIKSCVSLLIFCFDDLSIGVSGVVNVSYYYCVTVNFCFYVCWCLSYVNQLYLWVSEAYPDFMEPEIYIIL